jgi:hypothetical protein
LIFVRIKITDGNIKTSLAQKPVSPQERPALVLED